MIFNHRFDGLALVVEVYGCELVQSFSCWAANGEDMVTQIRFFYKWILNPIQIFSYMMSISKHSIHYRMKINKYPDICLDIQISKIYTVKSPKKKKKRKTEKYYTLKHKAIVRYVYNIHIYFDVY